MRRKRVYIYTKRSYGVFFFGVFLIVSGEKGEKAKAILLEIRLPMSVDCGDDFNTKRRHGVGRDWVIGSIDLWGSPYLYIYPLPRSSCQVEYYIIVYYFFQNLQLFSRRHRCPLLFLPLIHL